MREQMFTPSEEGITAKRDVPGERSGRLRARLVTWLQWTCEGEGGTGVFSDGDALWFMEMDSKLRFIFIHLLVLWERAKVHGDLLVITLCISLHRACNLHVVFAHSCLLWLQ